MRRADLERHLGHICRVTWTDAVGLSEWRSVRDACEIPLARVVSVGTVLALTSRTLVMAADRDDNGNVNGIGVVPIGWIKAVERLAPC